MKKSYRQTPSTKQKLRTRFMLVSGTTIILLTFTMGWLIFLNISLNTKIKASMTVNGGSQLSNGELVSQFTWESNSSTKATVGPDAMKISDHAHTADGGKAYKGLAPGTSRSIDMEIASSPMFDAEGIDVSIDFRRHESPQKGSAFHNVQSTAQ